MSKAITALLMGLLCFTSIGCGGDDEAERNRQNFKKDMANLDDAFNNSGIDQPRGSKSSGNTSAINLSELESLLGSFAQQMLDHSRWLKKRTFSKPHIDIVKTDSLVYPYHAHIRWPFQPKSGFEYLGNKTLNRRFL